MPGKGKPFTEGNRANPGGRPKALAKWRASEEAQRLRDLSYEALEDALGKGNETKDRITAARELLDRIEGRPVQAISGEDGGPIKVDLGTLDILKKLAP
jgi:hypothetical protein